MNTKSRNLHEKRNKNAKLNKCQKEEQTNETDGDDKAKSLCAKKKRAPTRASPPSLLVSEHNSVLLQVHTFNLDDLTMHMPHVMPRSKKQMNNYKGEKL